MNERRTHASKQYTPEDDRVGTNLSAGTSDYSTSRKLKNGFYEPIAEEPDPEEVLAQKEEFLGSPELQRQREEDERETAVLREKLGLERERSKRRATESEAGWKPTPAKDGRERLYVAGKIRRGFNSPNDLPAKTPSPVNERPSFEPDPVPTTHEEHPSYQDSVWDGEGDHLPKQRGNRRAIHETTNAWNPVGSKSRYSGAVNTQKSFEKNKRRGPSIRELNVSRRDPEDELAQNLLALSHEQAVHRQKEAHREWFEGRETALETDEEYQARVRRYIKASEKDARSPVDENPISDTDQRARSIKKAWNKALKRRVEQEGFSIASSGKRAARDSNLDENEEDSREERMREYDQIRREEYDDFRPRTLGHSKALLLSRDGVRSSTIGYDGFKRVERRRRDEKQLAELAGKPVESPKRKTTSSFTESGEYRQRAALQNIRRGSSIRTLKEIPPEERSKDFINAMDEISSEISDRRTDDAHDSGSSSREESAQRRMKKKPSHADREDGPAFRGRSQGRETIRRVPRNQLRASQEQGRSLHQDPVIHQKTSDRFTRQQNAQREERRFTWHSLLEGIQGFFRR